MADITLNDLKDIRFLYLTIIPIVTIFLYYFLIKKKTDIGIISTYNGVPIPSKWEINNAINIIIFKKREEKVLITKDLSSMNYSTDVVGNFIKENTSKIQELSNSNNVISLFLFAHMPISIYIGHLIGKVKVVDLYHRLRTNDRNQWKWKHILFKNKYKNKYKYIIDNSLNKNLKEVILDIDISFPIFGKNIIDDKNKNFYRIELKSLDENIDRRTFLKYKYQLIEFEKIIEKAFLDIETKLGSNCKIHLFLTAPNPFSFIIGQQIHNNGPTVMVYDKNSDGEYVVIKIIN